MVRGLIGGDLERIGDRSDKDGDEIVARTQALGVGDVIGEARQGGGQGVREGILVGEDYSQKYENRILLAHRFALKNMGRAGWFRIPSSKAKNSDCGNTVVLMKAGEKWEARVNITSSRELVKATTGGKGQAKYRGRSEDEVLDTRWKVGVRRQCHT